MLAAELAQHATTKMMPEGPAATVPAVVQAARPQPGGPVAAAAGGKRFSPRDYDPKLGADQVSAGPGFVRRCRLWACHWVVCH